MDWYKANYRPPASLLGSQQGQKPDNYLSGLTYHSFDFRIMQTGTRSGECK